MGSWKVCEGIRFDLGQAPGSDCEAEIAGIAMANGIQEQRGKRDSIHVCVGSMGFDKETKRLKRHEGNQEEAKQKQDSPCFEAIWLGSMPMCNGLDLG